MDKEGVHEEMGLLSRLEGLGRDRRWQKEGMPLCLKRQEGIKVGMLEREVQGGLLVTGVGRETVTTAIGKAIWGGPMDGLETWTEKLGFYSVFIQSSQRLLSRGTTC